jgi:hypothetical protein
MRVLTAQLRAEFDIDKNAERLLKIVKIMMRTFTYSQNSISRDIFCGIR